MKWEVYKSRFQQKAKRQGLSDKRIDECLSYAEALYLNELPVIYNLEHLSRLVGYNEDYIERVIDHSQYFYRYYSIPKKSGGLREIAEPLPSLKEIQRWILENVLYKCDCSVYAKAYVPKKSIKSNAKFHRNQNKVLTIDIENYFPSISEFKVESFFLTVGYNSEVAFIFAKLCCLNKVLPQGAPTSPMLSNLVTKSIDDKIANLAMQFGLRYSRYADDLTISGDFKAGIIINQVKEILYDEGFSVNNSKIRVQGRNEQQRVTGIVVNEKLALERRRRKQIRQVIYFIRKFGFEEHSKRIRVGRRNYFEHIVGLVNYALFINPYDQEMISYSNFLKQIRVK